MGKFRRFPITVEAVQFTGDNWAEMHDFTGHVRVDGMDHPVDVFAPIDTHIRAYEFPDCWAELYVETVEMFLPVHQRAWIIKNPGRGFIQMNDEEFRKAYGAEEDFNDLVGVIDTGDIPVLDETVEDSRILGRIRLALIVTRPMPEVDAICERLVEVFKERMRADATDHRQ